MTNCDILVIGHVSKDIIITPEDESSLLGGAVIYAAINLQKLGAKVIALTKVNKDEIHLLDVFKQHGVSIHASDTAKTTSIKNTYHTADRERRTCQAIAVGDPFTLQDIPADIEPDCFYFGGLIKGEFSEELVIALSKKGKTAVDAQAWLRANDNGELVFTDWDKKRETIPHCHYFKTDAAEAEIITGISDRVAAAKKINEWGAKEVMLTHNSEVMICAEGKIITYPFTSKQLDGRTGRGDTCFSTYCYWRIKHSPEESCLQAAALTSLKMETPGPFTGTLEDVQNIIKERY